MDMTLRAVSEDWRDEGLSDMPERGRQERK